MPDCFTAVVDSPLGLLGIETSGPALKRIDFLSSGAKCRSATNPTARRVVNELEAYFSRAEHAFSLDLALVGTPFQRSVWCLLQEIPLGEVRTYGELAKQLNSSPRAVGNACRNNPIPVIVPCHRVVSAQGLGGYAGQTRGPNMDIKTWLLIHEGVELE